MPPDAAFDDYLASAALYPLKWRTRAAPAYALAIINADPTVVIRAIRAALRYDPHSPNLLYQLAIQQIRTGDLAAASVTISAFSSLAEPDWKQMVQLWDLYEDVRWQAMGGWR